MRKMEIDPHGDMQVTSEGSKLIIEFENEPEIHMSGIKDELLTIRTWFDQAFKYIGRNVKGKSWFTSDIESEE